MAAPEELDLDPIEPVEEPKPAPKAKGTKPKGARPEDGDEGGGKGTKERTAKSGPEKAPPRSKKADADEDDEEPRRRPPKLGDRKVPYPPSPANVPEELTEYPESYTKQENLLLAGLFLFLSLYIGAVLFCVLICVWCIWSLGHWFPIKVAGIFFSSVFFLFLVKGFFKRAPIDRDMNIELTEDEHPVLFEFIYRLCEEVGAPLPNKVLVAPDVNAMCINHTSLFSLFKEPKKDLLIGLGLVNAVNMSEFKAILAHEFGHFAQAGTTRNYAHIAQYVIYDMIRGEDWFDRMIAKLKHSQQFRGLGLALGGPLWLWRVILGRVFDLIALRSRAVSREREFHADLVAVSAAGSDAATHGLLRARFGMMCFIQALRDLSTAMDHKLYSNDLYLHQSRAAAVVRRLKKEPELGLPPALPHPDSGKTTRVFDAEQEELEDEDDTPPMWRSHPPDAAREENAKEQFVAAVMDHRSPWILFDDPADLKERMTYKFFRMHPAFRIPKNADLSDAIKVQKFIDNEHADTTYDPKYKGAYDERILEPGDLSELNTLVHDNPWTEERMEKVLDKLYDGCEEHAEAHSELYKELESLRSGIVGRPSPKMKRKIEEVEKKQEENREWFKSFDRRVYLLHVQMAAQVDKDLKQELVERYRFQLEVQRLYQESRNAFNKADAYLSAYAAWQRGQIQLPQDFAGEVIQVLRESWKILKNIIKDARDINLPAMKNFEEGENLADFILEGKMVPEPPLSYVKGVWIDKLMTQLQGVRMRCFRLHFKSVGGVLRIHEAISAKWKALREPVAAEVLDVEPITAEVIAAEPIPAEVVAEVLPDEVIAAEVIPEELPLEPAPPAPTAPVSETPKATAAFVAPPSAAPPVRSGLQSPPVPAAAHPVPAPAEKVVWGVEPSAPSAPPAPVAEAPVPSEPAVPEPVAVAPAPEPAAPEPAVPASAAPDRVDEPECGSGLRVHAVGANEQDEALKRLLSQVKIVEREPNTAPPVEKPPVPEPPAIEKAAPAPAAAAEEIIDAEIIEDIAIEPHTPPVPTTPPFSLNSEPAWPTPRANEVFSLDGEVGSPPAPLPALPPAKPPALPPKSAPPAPAAPVAAEEIFSLDADESEPTVPAVPVEEVFSLDTDDKPAAIAKAPEPKPASGAFPAVAAKPAGSAAVPAPAPRVPAVPEPAKPLSGAVEAPAKKPAFGSGSFPVLGALSLKGKRPPIKITMVKPGEKSPLAK